MMAQLANRVVVYDLELAACKLVGKGIVGLCELDCFLIMLAINNYPSLFECTHSLKQIDVEQAELVIGALLQLNSFPYSIWFEALLLDDLPRLSIACLVLKPFIRLQLVYEEALGQVFDVHDAL